MLFSPVTGNYSYSIRTTAPAAAGDRTQTANLLTDSPLQVDLTRNSLATVEPGSVVFTVTGKRYIDRNGTIYTDLAANGTATEAGSIDYASGLVTLNTWVDNTAIALSVEACLAIYGTWVATEATFRTSGSPLRSQSAYIQVSAEDGELLTATTDSEGNIVSDHARGKVNNEMGVVFIQWGNMVTAAGNEGEDWYNADDVVGGLIWKPRRVAPGTIRYNGVVLSNLPLDADRLGLDPVRLPTDGRVPIYRGADVAVIHNTKTLTLPNPAVAGATYDCERTDLAEAWLIDTAGARVSEAHFVADLEAGTITMAADLDLTGVPQPLTLHHRIEQLVMLTDAQINGQLSLAGPLARDFDADSYVSSAILFGDMFARASNLFDQVTWTGAWSDDRIGDNATAEFNAVDFPIEVLNDGAITERWRINFTNSTGAFQVIGENLGVIATGSTAADLQPINPLTGKPYFTLRKNGWGLGWSTGNQLRFNTIGATAPIWIARTVLPGATLAGDSFDVQLRGDVDA